MAGLAGAARLPDGGVVDARLVPGVARAWSRRAPASCWRPGARRARTRRRPARRVHRGSASYARRGTPARGTAPRDSGSGQRLRLAHERPNDMTVVDAVVLLAAQPWHRFGAFAVVPNLDDIGGMVALRPRSPSDAKAAWNKLSGEVNRAPGPDDRRAWCAQAIALSIGKGRRRSFSSASRAVGFALSGACRGITPTKSM